MTTTQNSASSNRTSESSINIRDVLRESASYERKLHHEFQLFKKLLNKLHEALSDAWWCSDLAHIGQFAKLCLDAEVQTGVSLDFAISCREKKSDPSER